MNVDKFKERQFILIRGGIGFFFFYLFYQLAIYSNELLTDQGTFSNNFVGKVVWPNIFLFSEKQSFVVAMLFIGMIASIGFALGKYRIISTFVLLFLLINLRNKNPTMFDIHTKFLAWLLLATCFIPEKERWRYHDLQNETPWKIPPWILSATWIVLGICYTASGIHKLPYPLWLEGKAVPQMLKMHSTSNFFLIQWIKQYPPIGTAVTELILFTEILFFPAIFWRPTRFLFWFVMTSMKIILMTFTRFHEIGFGLVLFNLFIFDIDYALILYGKFKHTLKKIIRTLNQA